MSRISYFQRFSQRENHATNNTLLLLRHFYQASPFKLERALSALVGQDFRIGLNFEQQVRGQASVPDALISQDAFRVFIETKRGATLELPQIVAHLKSISLDQVVGRTDFLLGLTKETLADNDIAHFGMLARQQRVAFAAVTFSQVVEFLRAECEISDQNLLSMVADYEEYLTEEGLLSDRNRWLPIFPCGISYDENKHFAIYYTQPSRPVRALHEFIGIYALKRVSLIGRIKAILLSDFDGGSLSFTVEAGICSDADLARVQAIIEATHYYDLRGEAQRFYVFDKLYATGVTKTSPGGIQGMRYLDLAALLPDFTTARAYEAADLADLLNGKTFA